MSSDSACDSVGAIPSTPEWISYGGFIILIYGTIITFWGEYLSNKTIKFTTILGLAAICDFYFVPALKILCKELKVPSDVAGATFMSFLHFSLIDNIYFLPRAGGASSPEMFVSFLGLFVSKSNIGVGTIIGSEIFNHMCISAGSVLYAKEGKLKLDPWIFSREIFAYLSSIFVLIYVLKGNISGSIRTAFFEGTWTRCCSVSVGDTLLLLGMYVLYAIIAGNFKKIVRFFKLTFPQTFSNEEEVRELRSSPTPSSLQKPLTDSEASSQIELNSIRNPLSPYSSSPPSRPLAQTAPLHTSRPSLHTSRPSESHSDPFEDSYSRRISLRDSLTVFSPPDSSPVPEEAPHESILSPDLSLVYGYPVWLWLHYLVLPLKYLLYYTNYSLHSPERRPLYPYTLLSCIIWLALLAEAMIEALQALGYMVGASPLIMGLTFSAAGTSLPNIYSSMIVARQGEGDMAISNALGSNTFNIYIGLGFPWLIYTLAYGDLRSIQDGGVVILLLILLFVLVVYYVVIICHGWEIRRWMAYPLILTYVLVIIYCIVIS